MGVPSLALIDAPASFQSVVQYSRILFRYLSERHNFTPLSRQEKVRRQVQVKSGH